MKEIVSGLFVGGSDALEAAQGMDNVAQLQICSESFFREMYEDEGIIGQEKPFVKMMSKMMIKLENYDSPDKFNLEAFVEAVNFIKLKLAVDTTVVITGEMGRSRAPSIAMLYLAATGRVANGSFDAAEQEFKAEYYPDYEPKAGLKSFLSANWGEICGQ